MGNRGRHDVQSHSDGLMIVTAKWALRLGPHGMTGTLINSTEGKAGGTSPSIVCGGAAEPSILTLKFNADGTGNSLAPQLLYSEAHLNTCSGTLAFTGGNSYYSLQEVTGSSVNGEFVYRVLVSGTAALPTSIGAAPYSASLDPGLTGSFFGVFKRNNR